MLFIFLLESMQLSWGFFLSSLLFLVTLCVSKRTQGLCLLLLNTDVFPLALVLVIRAAAEERKEKGSETTVLPALLVCAQNAARTEAIAAGHCASPAVTRGCHMGHGCWNTVMPQ